MIYQRFCLGRQFRLYFKVVLLFLFLAGFHTTLYAQGSYLMSITNGEKIDQKTYEFDVYLKSTGDGFQLTSYQAVFSFNTSILNNGSLSFTYLEGTSDLINLPSLGIGLNESDGKAKLTFASLPGSDIITGQNKRVGRFRLQSSGSIDVNPSINWNFQGKITTIVTGTAFENITNPSNHASDIGGITQMNVAEVTASGIPDEGTAPEKTIDGLGYYDSDPLSRWSARPMPQWISYDLGSEQIISTVKISFFGFQLNRIYEYSVSVSNDNTKWTEVVSNANSIAEEWTIAEFSPVNARYVKLDLISSTENPNNWANIWETEIWGGSSTTSAEEVKTEPSDFELLQNYPNPFNPATKITFNLREDANAKLAVYNILGEKVTDLIDDFLRAGKHEIVFNGDNLASGIYIYKLDVDNKFTDLKKMILIK